MQLLNIDTTRFPTLESEVVRRRGARKLYYLHDGRNAWWTTWVQRYYNGCMHSSLWDAQRHAERMRVQGSVFYIVELPAVILEGDSLVCAITQINTTSVLAGYSCHAVTPDAPPGYRLRDDARENYLTVGSPLRGAYASFDPVSRFWRRQPPLVDAVIRVFGSGRLEEFEGMGRGPMRRYKSQSVGRAYQLSWTRSSAGLRRRDVNRIARSRPKHPD